MLLRGATLFGPTGMFLASYTVQARSLVVLFAVGKNETLGAA